MECECSETAFAFDSKHYTAFHELNPVHQVAIFFLPFGSSKEKEKIENEAVLWAVASNLL